MTEKELVRDGVDHQLYPLAEGVFLSELDIRLRKIIARHHPDLTEKDFVSYQNLAQYRLIF